MRILRIFERSSLHFQRTASRYARTDRSFSSKSEANAVVEIGVALGFGLVCGCGMRYLTERDIKNWKPQRDLEDAKQPVIRSRLTQEQKQNREVMSMFQAWLDKEKLSSPHDPKNTADFKYITFTELPPFTSQHRSALASVMSPSLWDQFKSVRTRHGFSFSNAIQSGVIKPEAPVGFAAGDEESYTVFEEVIYRMITALHRFDPYTQAHTTDLDPSHLLIPTAHQEKLSLHVRRTRIEAIRNLSGLPLPCGASAHDRRQTESLVKQVLSGVTSQYYALGSLAPSEEAALRALSLSCPKPDANSALANAGGAREWADGRGVLVNADGSVAAVVNESDHCTLIVTEPSANIQRAFERLCAASDRFSQGASEHGAAVMQHPQLGFLTTCPSHVGSALTASLSVHLPSLNQDPAALRHVAGQARLFAFRPSEEPLWHVSTRPRVGVSEVELLRGMAAGVVKLIEVEETMAANPSITAAEALKLVNARA